MATIALIEDDQSLRQMLSDALAGAGYIVNAEDSGYPGLQMVIDQKPDLVVLDLGLPDIDGGELIKLIRGVSKVPIIIATARDDENEIVRLLNDGADDYVVKPFGGKQLVARISAILRRYQATDSNKVITIGGLEIDISARDATFEGAPLNLNRKEFEVLALLASKPGEVVDRRELYAEVWRQPYGGNDTTIDVHISRLRGKLGETAAEPRYLHTVRGIGIKLIDPT